MKTIFSINYEFEFIFFVTVLVIISLILVVIPNNPIYSVLFLMLSFLNIVILLIMVGVEFLSILLLVIYVGAISILFLFVIMMIDIKFNLLTNKRSFSNFYFIFKTFFFIFLLVLFYLLYFVNYNLYDLNYYTDWMNLYYVINDVKVIGYVLYNFYYYYFILVGIILFVAMVGCISLVLDSNPVSKKQDLYNQILNSNLNNLILFKRK